MRNLILEEIELLAQDQNEWVSKTGLVIPKFMSNLPLFTQNVFPGGRVTFTSRLRHPNIHLRQIHENKEA